MTATKTPPGIWVGQGLHFGCLAVLLALVAIAWKSLSQPFPCLFWGAIGIPVVHQICVWLSWRLELQSSTISKTIGFSGYVVGFFLFFGGRFLSLLILAWLDRGSLGLQALPQIIITICFALPGFFAMYSVIRYFGMKRASGADHFEPKYRDMPLVKEGIFKYTNNGMYLYTFFLFWAIAFGFGSSATLVVTAFSHAYIWVHFFATEKPDMNFLYGSE